MSQHIVKAMVVIRRPEDGAILVSENEDASGRRFERPLGGHVEFGERAADAAAREIREEIGQQLDDIRLLGVLENIFHLDGTPAHEIVFVFEGGFADHAGYAVEQQVIKDDPSGRTRVRWRRRGRGESQLVPSGIEELIWP